MALELEVPRRASWRRLSNSFAVLSAVSVAALAVACVCLNVVVHRIYARWDWTSSGLYTLSQATTETLVSLQKPTNVAVFLAKSDPLAASIRQLLSAYGAQTTHLRTRFVDPDQDPATFAALQAEYGIVAGKTEDGRIVTDAVIVLAEGQRKWFITLDNIVGFDEEAGTHQPKLEQALTEGLRNLQAEKATRLCFTVGNQELSQENLGPQGLSAFVSELTKNNYVVSQVDLTPPLRSDPFARCDALVIAAPQQPWPDAATAQLTAYTNDGGRVLALLSANVDQGRIRPTGLEIWLKKLGLELGQDVVIEGEPERRLPSGIGETFFVESQPHAITHALARPGSKVQYRLLVSSAQSLHPLSSADPATLTPLLRTSPSSFSLKDPSLFADAQRLPTTGDAARHGPLTLAYAVERKSPKDSRMASGRVLVVGASNIAWSRAFQDPTWAGDRLFLESAISWLVARPLLVNVPAKPTHPAGLALSEAALGELLRYVLLYMPLSALGLGAWVLFRRRKGEERSRLEGAKSGE